MKSIILSNIIHLLQLIHPIKNNYNVLTGRVLLELLRQIYEHELKGRYRPYNLSVRKKTFGAGSSPKSKPLVRRNWRDNIEKEEKKLLRQISLGLYSNHESQKRRIRCCYLHAVIRTTFVSGHCGPWAIVLHCRHGCSILWRISR